MHCESCKKLIMMELSDAGLDSFVEKIDLLPDKKGILSLQDRLSDDDYDKVISIINGMGSYKVE